eukprot:2794650-Lingulodinium_polyedra.AAC.1
MPQFGRGADRGATTPGTPRNCNNNGLPTGETAGAQLPKSIEYRPKRTVRFLRGAGPCTDAAQNG